MASALELLLESFDIENGDPSRYTHIYSSSSGGSESGHSSDEPIGLVDAISSVPGTTELQNQQTPTPRIVHGRTERRAEILSREPIGVFGEICNRMYNSVKACTKRYISDVFRCADSGEAARFSRLVRTDASGTYRGGLLIIRQHVNHVHVVHLCTFASGHCRCSFIEKAKSRADIGGRRERFQRKYANRLSPSDCARILEYFGYRSNHEGYKFFIIAGQVEGSLCGSEIFQEQGYLDDPSKSEQHSLETCLQVDQIELQPDEQIRDTIEQTGSARSKRNIATGGSRKKIFQKSILDMCHKYCMAPIKDIFNHVKWLRDPELQFIRADNKLAMSVLDTFAHDVCNWSLKEFYDMYMDPNCNPCFCARDNDPFKYYYSVDKSVEILTQLVRFQFGNNELDIYDFLLDLYNVVERNAGKCNSILVLSPHSAGKNFFFDTLLAFCLNKGQLGNPNKHNTFAFQEAAGKRILLWNEPNYENSQIDKLKMVLGGDNYTVNVKCKSDVAVIKTPVIVLTNKVVGFMEDVNFSERVHQYTWMAAPFLAEYSLKPHPIAIYELFKNYGIIKE